MTGLPTEKQERMSTFDTPVHVSSVIGATLDGYARAGRKAAIRAGDRFGRLTAVKIVSCPPGKKSKEVWWEAQCECGSIVTRRSGVLTGAIKRGEIASCGCSAPRPHALPIGVSAIRQLYLTYRCRARRHGRVFEISVEEFAELIGRPCSYCGSPPSQLYGRKGRQCRYNGIDRIDSRCGYTLENAQACCGICNRAKSNLTEQQFAEWIGRLVATNRVQWRPGT